ncbi:MAG TPA: hypothetical protein VMP68_05730 [Candidatus Eisenbacteria bacterium]|nr:hypothetical protein [Candidatus Eisenbacteria bacterium]
MDKPRLVLEKIRVTAFHPSFRLRKKGNDLVWEGSKEVTVAGSPVELFTIRVTYPEAFPTKPPIVEVLNPILDSTDVGHEWHRWVEGNVCYIRPRDWNIATTVDQIIDKVTDWYHNYMAVKLGLVDRMPDVGRVTL